MRRLMMAAATAVLLLAPSPVQAGTVESGAKKSHDGVSVSVRRQHNAPRPRPRVRRGVSPRRCIYKPGATPPQVSFDQGYVDPPPPGEGAWFTVICARENPPEYSYQFRFVRIRSAAAAQAADLIEEAQRQLVLPEPEIRTSPPAGTDAVVSVPTFLWVPAEAWESQETTAEIPGVAVTVRAEPERVVWSMGNGDQVECFGPGEPWNPALPEAAQPSSCRYTYRSTSVGQPDERFTITAQVHWKASWSVEGAPGGGDLGEITRSSSAAVRVAQIQTVNIY